MVLPKQIYGCWVGVGHPNLVITFYRDNQYLYLSGAYYLDSGPYTYNAYTGIGSMLLYDEIKAFTVADGILTFEGNPNLIQFEEFE